MSSKKTKKETYTLNGSDVVAKIKQLVAEGNVRKITIKDKENREIAHFTLTIGVVGLVIAPVLAAIGTMVALLSECSITVEKEV